MPCFAAATPIYAILLPSTSGLCSFFAQHFCTLRFLRLSIPLIAFPSLSDALLLNAFPLLIKTTPCIHSHFFSQLFLAIPLLV